MRKLNTIAEKVIVDTLIVEGLSEKEILETCNDMNLNIPLAKNILERTYLKKKVGEELIKNLKRFKDTNEATKVYMACLKERIKDVAPDLELEVESHSYFNEIYYNIRAGKGLMAKLFGKALVGIHNCLNNYGGEIIIHDKSIVPIVSKIVADLNKKSKFNFEIEYA